MGYDGTRRVEGSTWFKLSYDIDDSEYCTHSVDIVVRDTLEIKCEYLEHVLFNRFPCYFYLSESVLLLSGSILRGSWESSFFTS
jgi:hypothetical protein